MKYRHIGISSEYQNLEKHVRTNSSTPLSKTPFKNLASSKSLPVGPALKGGSSSRLCGSSYRGDLQWNKSLKLTNRSVFQLKVVYDA